MAKTTDWGLTDAGFRRPTYAELLDALEYKARELFGSKANLTVRSPLGIFLPVQPRTGNRPTAARGAESRGLPHLYR